MLTRRERTEVLVESGPALALELAGLVEAAAPAEDIVPAHQGLVMCQVRETARNSRFYLSEVLVTESRVRIGEADGLRAYGNRCRACSCAPGNRCRLCNGSGAGLFGGTRAPRRGGACCHV